MYTCKDVNQLLVDYLENQIPADVKKELDYHLSLCPNCVRFLNTYKKTIELTGRLNVKKMPAELEKSLLKFLTRRAS